MNNVVCWIPTNVVNQFKWVNSFLTAVVIVTNEHLNNFFIAKVPPLLEVKPRFRGPEKLSLPPE